MINSRLRVAYALGTRPEIIRSARLLRLMERHPRFDLRIIDSGQHYDREMSDDFIDELDVPTIHVDLKVGSADPVAQTAAIMTGTAAALADLQPQALCVFGDTNSSLGAALAAVKADLPLVHIEAGCRSHDMRMPEEINRRVIDHVSQLLLAVSQLGAANLGKESVPGRVAVVGDPLFDVFTERAPAVHPPANAARGLLTLHRPENVDDAQHLKRILDEIGSVSSSIGLTWIFPVHPRTRRVLPSQLSCAIEPIAPLGYNELLFELSTSRVCATDSGGLQKEAFWARVPCVTVRRSTEWMETLEAGANVLASAGAGLADAIERSVAKTLPPEFDNPYGDGRASERVIAALEEWLTKRSATGAGAG